MDLRGILEESRLLAGVPIPDKVFIRDFNRAANDLAMLYDTAKKRDTQVINCTDYSLEYDLLKGLLRIERVLDASGNYVKCFTVRGNSKIKFGFANQFTVYGMFAPDEITSMEDEIPIDSAYANAIAKYIAARALRKVSPEYTTPAGKKVIVSSPDSYSEFMSQFSSDAALANNNIRKVNNPNRTVVKRPFR